MELQKLVIDEQERIFLNGVEIPHISEYCLKNSVEPKTAELTIKMHVAIKSIGKQENKEENTTSKTESRKMLDTIKTVKGYKILNSDWTCNGFQYEVGKTYEMKEKAFHFYKRLSQCCNGYVPGKEDKIVEVRAYGAIIITQNGEIYATMIKIEREVPWKEVLDKVNTGRNCTGFDNTGNYNSGNQNTGEKNEGCNNTGNYNIGYGNTGDLNVGSWNTGDYNTGKSNSGSYNFGHRNTGDYNTSYGNAGDWNKADYSSGCFNTIEQPMYLFNKISNWSHWDWENSKARYILNNITKYHAQIHMTKKEMTKGNQKNWNQLSQKEKEIVMAIPNFDKAIFKEMTGIDVDEQKGETETCS